jgi:predicted nucleotide-binding protein
VLSKEFKIRSDISWQSLSRSLEIGDVEVLEILNADLNEELKLELNQQRQGLIDLIKSKLRNMGLLEHMKEIESSLSHFQNQAISKYGAEIDLYIDNLNKLAMLKRPQEAVTPEDGSTPDKRKIFVVHGRDDCLRDDFFSFLRALGLQPIEWSEALRLTGKATPYTGEAIESAFKNAQAVIVLLSPDDEVRLSPELWKDKEDEDEKETRLQARPNVLFEAGMAFGTHPNRTLLIEVGQVKAFSDVAGRHVVRLSNSSEGRTDIAEMLRTAGCDVSTSGSDWLKIGDFSVDRKKAN